MRFPLSNTHVFLWLPPGGATQMARGGIRLVHGLTKSTLITYFSGMKKYLKYVFLHAFFLICLSCSFQHLSIWPKTHPFFPLLHFFAPLNDVRAYSAWSWKTILITWIFGRAWYPPWHDLSGPPPGVAKGVTYVPQCPHMTLALVPHGLIHRSNNHYLGAVICSSFCCPSIQGMHY